MICLKKFLFLLFFVPTLLSAVEGNPFILFTVPKAGTFLSIKFLKALTGARERMFDEGNKDFYTMYEKKYTNGVFNFTHYRNHFDPKTYKVLLPNVLPIVTVRDPRDVVVSSVYYFSSVLNQLCGSNATFDQKLSFTIQYESFKSYFGPLYFFQRMCDFIDTVHPFVLHFEDLTGPKGGGSLEAQLNVVYHTAAYLNIPMTEERALQIANSLFGSSPTFRKGEIGSWKKHFKEEHKVLFKASKLQEILLRLGYETDSEW